MHRSLYTELPSQKIKGLVCKTLHILLKIYHIISVEDLMISETKIIFNVFLQL